MRLALAQYDIAWENKPENMIKCEKFIHLAAESECDLVLFPELSLTGFTMEHSLAETEHDPTPLFFSNCCIRHDIACVFGYSGHDTNKIYNKLVFFDNNGNYRGGYSKMHTFSLAYEDYDRGDNICCIDYKDMTIGLTICYDLRFPELFQALSRKCNCIVVSANWPESRRDHWLTLLKARAIENQCYVVGCNRTGTGNGITYSGDSCVIAPDGSVVASADNREQLVICDIDINAVISLRNQFPLKKDRRCDVYKNFYE